MLTPYRRHRAGCKHASRRYKSCSCPIWVQGTLDGVSVRRSLDLTNWEAANRRIRDLEVYGPNHSLSVKEACTRFLSDRKAAHISQAMMAKYRHVADELTRELGDVPLHSITPHDVRTLRESWTVAPITAQKRLELIRKFFSFCMDSDWLTKNPARLVEAPPVRHVPTLPFTDREMEAILWAAENIRVAHPKMPEDSPKKLTALILLMRYSGIRISDAVMFRRSLLRDKKLFLHQAKTGQPVLVPLPDFVIKAVMACDEGNEHFFYTTIGTPKTAITDWQWRLRKVYDMAGLPDGHSHRLRDTFSVDLLSRGVSLETVSILLGHKSIRTTEKHYAPFVKSRQDALEAAVRLSWTSA